MSQAQSAIKCDWCNATMAGATGKICHRPDGNEFICEKCFTKALKHQVPNLIPVPAISNHYKVMKDLKEIKS